MTDYLTVREVKEQLVDWRERYKRELTISAVCSKGPGISEAGEAFLAHISAPRSTIIGNLPLECLAIVFLFLSKRTLLQTLCYVCRRWAFGVKHPILWDTFQLQQLVETSELPVRPSRVYGPSCVVTKAQKEQFWLRQLVEGHFQCTKLYVTSAYVNGWDLERVGRRILNFSLLDLSFSSGVDDDALKTLLQAAAFTPQTPPNLTKNPFQPKGTQSISSLALNFCGDFSGAQLGQLLRQASWIKELELSGCTQLTAPDFCNVLRNSPNLASLKCRSTQFSTGSIPHEIMNLPLEVLHLGMCVGVTDETLQAIANHCNRLVDVVFSSCPVTDDGISCFMRHLRGTGLRRIDVDGCQLGDQGLLEIALRGESLVRVCYDRTKASGESLRVFLSCAQLQRMSLTQCMYVRCDIARDPNLLRQTKSRKHILTPQTQKFLSLKKL